MVQTCIFIYLSTSVTLPCLPACNTHSSKICLLPCLLTLSTYLILLHSDSFSNGYWILCVSDIFIQILRLKNKMEIIILQIQTYHHTSQMCPPLKRKYSVLIKQTCIWEVPDYQLSCLRLCMLFTSLSMHMNARTLLWNMPCCLFPNLTHSIFIIIFQSHSIIYYNLCNLNSIIR